MPGPAETWSGYTENTMTNFLKRSKKSLIILAVILVAAAAALSVNIRQVTVSGNSRYTGNEIVELIFPKRIDWNSAYCYAKERLGKEHLQIPFVEDYKIIFHGPFELEIIVHEKSVVGYVSYMSSYMYFDKDGIVVESTNKELEGIPRIDGLSFGHIVLHKPLPVESPEIFSDILKLTQVLETYGLSADRIQYDLTGTATLFIQDLEIFLGDSSDINGKIAELSDIMPKIAGNSGILYLNTYDPVNRQTMYTFKKKSQNN